MSENLPLHVATADEPIPEPSRHPLRNEPDMRAVTPLGVMLADLARMDDEVTYVEKLMDFVSETGCSLLAHYSRDGELGLMAGYPVDAQCRHRNRWTHYLIAASRKYEGREDLLLRTLVARRMCWDERPANPQETTNAVLDWLEGRRA